VVAVVEEGLLLLGLEELAVVQMVQDKRQQLLALMALLTLAAVVVAGIQISSQQAQAAQVLSSYVI
jgi:hypothetical protein